MAINWEEVEESRDGEHVPAGVYVIRITTGADEPAKQYSDFTWDIAEGPYKGNYAAAPDWMHRLIRSYKTNALPMYKQFFRRIEDSNPGFSFDRNEHNPGQFVGKVLGVVLREEEYEANDGNVKTRMTIGKIGTADEARNGTLKPLALKTLKKEASSTYSAPVSSYDPTEEVPFV